MWKNTEEVEEAWLDKGVTFDLDKNTFKFEGPNIEEFTEDIESFKKSKSVKSLSIGLELDKQEYGVTFNNKNMIINIQRKDGIKHEDPETAVLDNLDHIDRIMLQTQNLITQFIS